MLAAATALVGSFLSAGALRIGHAMDFKLIRAEYDRETERAYVELRASDDDGEEAIAAAIFSFRSTAACPNGKWKKI